MEVCPNCGYREADEWVSTTTAAKTLQVTKQTVIKWTKNGELPGSREEEFPGSNGFRTMIPVVAVAAKKKKLAAEARKEKRRLARESK